MAITREYKDRLFKFIFGNEKNKEWTLSLYNAVNGSNYTDADSIKFTTIDDALYISMKNDVSFLISDTLNLYEEQSTYNPNMPLRYLIYAGMSYAKYIETNSIFIYSSQPQHIPSPRCICFYNGNKDAEERTELRLSSLFDTKGDIEVIVTMININYGKNRELLEECVPLGEYSWFIDKIREYQKDMEFTAAVDKALDEMPDDFLIKPFLIANRAEVKIMCLTEYDEAKYTDFVRAEGEAIGITKGEAIGMTKGEAIGMTKGEAIGESKGMIKTIIGFFKDGLISEKDAAKRANMSLEDFRKAEALYCN